MPKPSSNLPLGAEAEAFLDSRTRKNTIGTWLPARHRLRGQYGVAEFRSLSAQPRRRTSTCGFGQAITCPSDSARTDNLPATDPADARRNQHTDPLIGAGGRIYR